MTKLPDEIIERLKKLATPTIANAIDEIGQGGIMKGIHAVGAGFKCAGRAVTVRQVTGPLGSFKVEDFRVGHMIDAAGPGDIIVVANGGAEVSTFGGMAAYAAKHRGIEGLVVDGGVRDREEIIEFGFDVFSVHVTPTPGKTRLKVEQINETIVACGVTVNPGDAILADGSGVAVLPSDHAEHIITLAEGYARDDEKALEELANGLSFTEALKKFAKI
ncbi:MAG: RraA family protein [Alphaproteobacteria bacterium]